MTKATQSILCLLFSLLVSEAYSAGNSEDSDITGVLRKKWYSSKGLFLVIDQNSHSQSKLSGRTKISCIGEYHVTGSVSKYTTFYLNGANNSSAIAITGQYFDSNGAETLVVTVMHTSYSSCKGDMTTKVSSYNLIPSNNDVCYPDTKCNIPKVKELKQTENFPTEAVHHCHLTGTWKNELGSNMTIKEEKNKTLSGQYYTAVEGNNGSSGGFQTALRGWIGGKQPVFSFSMIWKYGTSISSFIGQCVEKAPGEYLLETQWILMVKKTLKSSWMSFYTNMNTFHKV